MNALESLENEFQHFLLTGASAIEARVLGTERVPVATRLAIYGNAYRARLAETLEAHFPALAAHLGTADFDNLCAAYIDAHHSTFASIRFYGAEMGQFLAHHPHYKSKPLLGELAHWEWAMTEVFDAADALPIGVQALAEVAPQHWAELGFELHPSVRCLDLKWNVASLWKALTGGQAASVPAAELDSSAWLLWRRELQIYFRPLTKAEAEALDAVCAGQNFGELCVALSASSSEEEAPAQAAGYLREWVESGMIVGTRAFTE